MSTSTHPQDHIDDAFDEGVRHGKATSVWGDTHHIKRAPELIGQLADDLDVRIKRGDGLVRIECLDARLVAVRDGEAVEVLRAGYATVISYLVNDIYHNEEGSWADASGAFLRDR